jgi:hypothetical protein
MLPGRDVPAPPGPAHLVTYSPGEEGNQRPMTTRPQPPPIPQETPTQYLVSSVPPEHPEFRLHSVWVQWRGADTWSISFDRGTSSGQVITAAGECVADIRPDEGSSDGPVTRFDGATALGIARTLVATISSTTDHASPRRPGNAP